MRKLRVLRGDVHTKVTISEYDILEEAIQILRREFEWPEGKYINYEGLLCVDEDMSSSHGYIKTITKSDPTEHDIFCNKMFTLMKKCLNKRGYALSSSAHNIMCILTDKIV